jgi:hypothetical protein
MPRNHQKAGTQQNRVYCIILDFLFGFFSNPEELSSMFLLNEGEILLDYLLENSNPHIFVIMRSTDICVRALRVD